MIPAILRLVDAILALIIIVLIVRAVLSWLFFFNVASPRAGVVAAINQFVNRLTNPMLAPFQRLIPPIGGVDLSILVLLLLLFFLRDLLPWFGRLLVGSPLY